MWILEVENLKKSFKDFGLKGISFKLEEGYIMGFIGPNGAGKSTTIKLIMNLLHKDSGEIKIFGKDNIQYEKEVKNKIGFVFDENHFYEELTVSEMKYIIAPLYKEWDNAMFNRYVKRLELPPKKKIKDLSKGMKMKFSLAVALSHNARLLIMDEPTSGLDPIVRSELLEILSDVITDDGKSVFFSTHITSDLEKTADYITMINDGEIVLTSAKDEIINNYALVKGGKELIDSNTKKIFIGLKENSFGFEGLVSDKESAIKLFKDKALIERPTLDDIMLYTVRGNKID